MNKIIFFLLIFWVLKLNAQHIENPQALNHFFDQLRAHQKPNKIRITHVGDSHVIADIWTSHLRKLFQAKFGDGGRGWVLVGKGWRSFAQSQISYQQIGSWHIDTLKGGIDDGFLGLAGCSFSSDDSQNKLIINTHRKSQKSNFDQLFIHTLGQAQGGRIKVKIDGKQQDLKSTFSPQLNIQNHAFELYRPATQIELSPIGDGEVRFLSMSIEKKQGGLIYDALGLNGAQAKHLLRNQRRALFQSLALVKSNLLILSYGINELFSGAFEKTSYFEHMDYLLNALLVDENNQRTTQSCLITGAFSAAKNGEKLSKMSDQYQIQKQLAQKYHCAFWDSNQAMGGDIIDWQNQGLAQKDGVHLTYQGYEKVAKLLYEALMDLYEN